MGTEIERRFRVDVERLSDIGEGRYIKQSYLAKDPTIRVRIVSLDDRPATDESAIFRAELTVKGKGRIERPEWNIPIPSRTGLELMELAKFGVIEKVRHDLIVHETAWELDRFLGVHDGLWLAEVELLTVDAVFDRPPWLGPEVTNDSRFSNAKLATATCRFWDDT